MNKLNVKIHYIYHSGFAVETSNHFLVFDYYKEPSNADQKDKFLLEDLIKKHNNVLVFSSHSHEDHFNPVILEWEKHNPKTKYILSSDIAIPTWKDNYYKLSQYEELTLESGFMESSKTSNSDCACRTNSTVTDVYVKAYGSTDIGISFLVKLDGLTIFHAGDLNWWHWKDDSFEERKAAEQNFKTEIEKIKGESIDIAFFPVDPRLEEFYSIGAEYFIKEIHPEILIPMHFGDNANITKEFAEKSSQLPVKTVIINNFGEELKL